MARIDFGLTLFKSLLKEGLAWRIKTNGARDNLHKGKTREINRLKEEIDNIPLEANPKSCKHSLEDWVDELGINPSLPEELKRKVASSYFVMTGGQGLPYARKVLAPLDLETTLSEDKINLCVNLDGTATKEELEEVEKILERIIPLHYGINYKARVYESTIAQAGVAQAGAAICGKRS